MNLLKRQGYLFVVLLFFFQNTVLANSLTGEFTFNTRVPDVALVYFSEDKSLSHKIEPIINQVNKEFKPKLVVGAKGSRVVIKNSDTINHNSYVLDISYAAMLRS